MLLSIVMIQPSAAGIPFQPPDGRVLHMAGQSRAQFEDYVAGVAVDGRACPLPAGGAAYTSLVWDSFNPDSEDSGKECGEILYLLGRDWPMVLHLALWLGAGDLDDIAAGRDDELIRRFGRGVASAARPVYLRIGYEFDGPHNAYPPEKYVKAYRRIVDVLRGGGVNNAAWVWHGYAYLPTFGERDVTDWFPGDDYVDWVGVSLFAAGSEQLNLGRMLEVAREKKRPLMICESSAVKHGKRKGLSGEEYWNAWYAPFFAFIERNPEVKAFSIINYNWDSSESWKKLDWGDARLTADEYVVARWREKMADPRYLHGTADLYETLGWREK